MPKPLGFPRQARLLQRSEFTRVYQQGASVRHGWAILFHHPSRLGPEAPSRLGFTISRRVSKSAVVRNRIRRVWREAARHVRLQLRPGFDLVLNARVVNLREFSSREATQVLLQLARRADLLQDDPSPSV